MVAAPRLAQHQQEQHAGGGAGTSGAEAAAPDPNVRPGPQKPKPAVDADGNPVKPKLNPARKHVAAFAALKEAVTEANKSVIAACKANMPDASRAPPSQR